MDVSHCNNCTETVVTSVFIRLMEHETKTWDGKLWDVLAGCGRMFYVVDPAVTRFREPEQVPTFFRNVSLR
jgi:hypothetical protein